MAAMNLTCAVDEKEKLAWRGGAPVRSTRVVAEERAVALTYCGSTYAVMMATPDDLEDFGRGFSITEGIVERPEEISSIEVLANDIGIEVRMWLHQSRAGTLAARRRAIAGPVGCGLCGIESLEQACPPPRQVDSCCKFHARYLLDAMSAL